MIKYKIVNSSISERKEIYKQEVKANIVILNFILDNKEFPLMKYYITRIVFHFFRKLIK